MKRTPRLLLLLLAAATGGAGAVVWLSFPSRAAFATAADEPKKPLTAPRLFPEGPKPELCVVLSGQMQGYLQPCGCARPQVGGLERRFELIKKLQDMGIPVTAADLGDLAPKESGVQPKMKYETALQMLQKMPYAALGIGATEFEMSLEEALPRALNYQPPWILAANLLDPKQQFPEMFKGWTLAQPDPKGLKVAYVGLLAESVIKKAQEADKAKSLTFTSAAAALPKVLAEIKETLRNKQESQPDLFVLLFQGSPGEAQQFFQQFPDAFDIILSKADADIASALPTRLKRPDGTEALLVNVGHKGRSVGLVGANRGQQRPALRYQMVELTEPFELPDEQTNPIRDLMKEYVLAVYRANLLTGVPRSKHPMQLMPGLEKATYVGAAKCLECHPSPHKVWSGSKHALGWTNLAKYGRPLADRGDGQKPRIVGRQFDPECASCHTTGFGIDGGFVDEKTTPHLLGNQCENCHGPGSLHVADGQNGKNTKFSTPMRLVITDPNVEKRCQTCHDGDNDPHFDLKKYWEQIKHGKETAAGAGK